MFKLKIITAKKTQKLSKLVLENIEGLSYSALMKIFRRKDVKVNGKRVSEDLTVKSGDRIEVFCVLSEVPPFEVIYSDDNVVVINKKSGFTSEAVFEAVKKDFPSAGFIHRLDRNTAGIMIFSLNMQAETELLFGFKHHTFNKKYLATVFGVPEKNSATLDAYLKKNADTSTVKVYDAPVKGSTPIRTGYEVISSDGETSVLEVTLYTGKTHQIRAHLAHIGHFVVGDGKYGDNAFNKSKGVKSQMLKAHKLKLSFAPSDSLYYLDGKTFAID